MDFKMRKFYVFISACIAFAVILLFASGCRDVEADPAKNLELGSLTDASTDASTDISPDSLPDVLADGAVIGKLIEYDINIFLGYCVRRRCLHEDAF
jgi:hypothetical protein